MSSLEYLPVLWVAGPCILIGVLMLALGRRARSVQLQIPLLTGVLLAALLCIYSARLFWRPGPVPGNNPIVVVIEPGSTPSAVAELLQANNVINNTGDLVMAARLTLADRSFQAGRYHFTGGENILEVLEHLTRGGTTDELVTIPEGLRPLQIASIISREAQVDSAAFMALAADSAFIASVISVEDGQSLPAHLEGYILPETFNIYYRMPADEVLRMMVSHFTDLWESRLAEAAADLGLTRHEVATLASIIEREAATGGERVIISAVFHNRLQRRMRLESCATVLYALGRFKPRLYERDLEIDSPYNTFRVRGLPPGPIANAGAASLLAAVSPADVDYLYFVARGDGTHTFSRTYAEHLAAKRGQGTGVLVGGRAAREAGRPPDPPSPGSGTPEGR